MPERVHRALSSPVRGRIMELLSDGGPQDTRQLADRLRLHVNTVRAHLTVLEEAGLVASEADRASGPGRPRLRYRVTPAAPKAGNSDGYRFLASVLAGQLAATAADPAAVAEQAGAAWGGFLIDGPAPFATVNPRTAIARVVELLDEGGFAPELDDAEEDAPRVLLRRCPFLQVAKEHPEVVCSLHLGIIRGALAELRTDVRATGLRPFVSPGLCVTELEVPA